MRAVVRGKAFAADSQQVLLPLSGLGAGLYLVRLEAEGFSHSEKLVVK